MAAKTQDFDKLLLNSIDEALLSIGKSVQQSIYFHIEKNFNITKDEILKNPERFQVALEKIFGVGSRYIEILIMKSLYAKIDRPLNMDKNGLEFTKYVAAAREAFVKEN